MQGPRGRLQVEVARSHTLPVSQSRLVALRFRYRLLGQVPAGLGPRGAFVIEVWSAGGTLDVGARARAGVDKLPLFQLIECLLIERKPLRLEPLPLA